MKLKQYQKYKETNIDWIDKIPNEWNIKKIKHFSISIAGGTPNTTTLSYWDGNIPWLPSGMIHDDLVKIEDVKTFITLEGLQNSSTKWIKKDAVLVALTGATCANIAYLTFRATANQSVIGIECDNKSYPKFFFYYLLSQREQILLNKTGGAQAGINKEDVKNLICAYPIKETQKYIADFLDKKTTNINGLLERDKQLIGLLNERRIAMINHVVTKGLNPKVKFKDSGIDWIDKIPEHWKIKRVKHLTLNLDGRRIPISAEFREEGEVPYYGATGILEYVRDFIFNEELLLIGEDGAPFFEKDKNVSFVIKGKTWVNNHAHVLRVNKENKIHWLCYFLNANDYKIYIKGSTRDKLNQDELSSILVLVPLPQEQTQIVAYLDKATSMIDEAVKKIEIRIELLEEYKKSLIHNVVTGKVNVQGGDK